MLYHILNHAELYITLFGLALSGYILFYYKERRKNIRYLFWIIGTVFFIILFLHLLSFLYLVYITR